MYMQVLAIANVTQGADEGLWSTRPLQMDTEYKNTYMHMVFTLK